MWTPDEETIETDLAYAQKAHQDLLAERKAGKDVEDELDEIESIINALEAKMHNLWLDTQLAVEEERYFYRNQHLLKDPMFLY